MTEFVAAPPIASRSAVEASTSERGAHGYSGWAATSPSQPGAITPRAQSVSYGPFGAGRASKAARTTSSSPGG